MTTIPFVERLRERLKGDEREADKLGVTMGEADVQAAKAYHDALEELKASWQGMSRELVVSSLPALQAVMGALYRLGELLVTVADGWRAIFAAFHADWNAMFTYADMANAALKKAWDGMPDFTAHKSEPGGTGAPSTLGTPKQGPSALEQMREQWNRIKEEQLGTDNDLLVMEIFFWQKKLAAATAGSKDYLEIHNHIVELETELAKRSQEEDAKAQKAITDGWMRTFESIPSAWDSAIRGMTTATESFGLAISNMFDQLLHEFLAYELKTLEQHEATELAKRNISAQTALARVASESAAVAQIIALHALEVADVIAGELLKVAAYAITAAAAAWSAIAGIPFVGPFLAPVIAAATLAGVLALAHGGGGGGSGGGVSGPSQSASSQSASSSSGNVTHNYYINAIDTQSFHQALMKNSSSVAKAANAGVSNGARLPTGPGRGSA